MVLRSAQAERAVRPYCAQSDIWPSSAIRRACGAIERTSIQQASHSRRLRGGMVGCVWSDEEAKELWF